MPDPLCVATLNVAGFRRSNLKIQQVFNEVKKYSLVCLQETHFQTSVETRNFDQIFGGTFKIYHSVINENCRGMTLLINHNHLGTCHRKVFELEGRAMAITYSLNGVKIFIIGIYAPANATHRPGFYRALNEKLRDNHVNFDIALMMGDFNFVENPVVDRSSFSDIRGVERGSSEFQIAMALLEVKDIYRSSKPEGKEFSHFSRRHKSFSRIDRIYASQAIFDSLQGVTFESKGFTDHRLFSANFSLIGFYEPRGPSYWKMNINLLKETDIREQIVNLIQDFSLQNKVGQAFLEGWDNLKHQVQRLYIFHSTRIARDRRRKSGALQSRMESFEKLVHLDPTNELYHQELNFARSQLRSEEEGRVKAALLQTHYRDICTDSCFLHTARKLQKKSAENRHFYAVKAQVGTVFYKTNEIVNELLVQMSDLFATKGSDVDDMHDFLTDDLPKLDFQECEDLDSNITADEITAAMKSMSKGKSPGSDGLPVEFYLTFSFLLIPLLGKLYKECFTLGHLSQTMYKGIISMLYKGKGSRQDRSNWRPLTMLNVDYKILAKILTIRANLIMSKLVHPNQTCAIRGRDIRDGLLSLYNTVQTIIDEKLQGILLSIDHMAAFDVIEWNYIFESLKCYGFGANFVQWIKMIYSTGKVNSSLMINGFVSAEIFATRGIRQGCPLSPPALCTGC